MADVTISFTVPDAQVAAMQAGFLAEHPKPLEDPGASMTDRQWIKHIIKSWIVNQSRRGQRQLNMPVPDQTDYLPND